MSAQKFANNASSLLAASIDEVETTIQVDSGYGALFPDPGTGEYFVIALENATGDIEICKVTDRASDLFTVVRGWEDTVAQAWTVGVTRVELRNTAGTMRGLLQKSGDVMEGNLDMDGNQIIDAHLTGATVIGPGSVIQGPTITNSNGDSCNAITIPENCDPPQIGGSPIMTTGNFDPNSVFAAGMIVMWYGVLADIPDGWALCDGNNGRPDLRNRFIVGVGSDYVLGDTGGDDILSGLVTSELGAIGSGTTGSHVLTIDEIPAHKHNVGSRGSDASTNSEPRDFIDNLPSRNGYYVETSETGGGAGHSHSVDQIPAHSHTIANQENRPPYYALYYIIKVDPAGDYGGVGGGGSGGSSGDMYDMYNEDGCTTYLGGRSTLMASVDTVASQVQINCCESNVFKVVLEENVTILEPNNPISGQVINIILKQDLVGSRLVTWDTAFKFPNGVAPTLTTTPGARDIVTCQYDSGDECWYCGSNLNFT